MARPEQHVTVADVAALAPGEARSFTFDDGECEGRGFVLAVPDHAEPPWVAYRNRCAHVSFDLDMGTGEFWSAKRGRIYCRTHGACYEPRSGICDHGPCVGERLEKFAVVRDGAAAIIIKIPFESVDTDA